MSQQKEPKDWKYILQQTGLPLEQSVKAVLQQHGVLSPQELKFERTDESDKLIVSSVDIYGSLSLDPFTLRLLVECKYRRDDVQWVFAPHKANGYGEGTRRDVLNVMPWLHKDVKLGNRGLTQKMRIPMVGKGVEMKGSDTMDAPIRKALFQLRYGAQHLFRNYLEYMGDESIRWAESVPALVPIVVTTAELWRMRDDVGVDEVRSADHFTDVAERANVLLINEPADPTVERECASRLRAAVGDEGQREIDELCKGKHPSGFRSVTRMMAKAPSYFYVMSFAHFNSSFRTLKSYFENYPHEKVTEPPSA